MNAVLLGEGWQGMGSLAIGLYALLKAISWQIAGRPAADWRKPAYLFAWPGMDAAQFASPCARVRQPSGKEWAFAVAKLGLGLGIVLLAVPSMPESQPLLAGWVGMIGCVLALHFGLFHVLSCLWRSHGRGAAPLMDWPLAAGSVAEFWGRRWNRAFRDLAHRLLFRPLEPMLGAGGALFTGFLASGLIHDLVISVPAGAGYGWPTIYFLLQALGIAIERRLRLRRGPCGRVFTALVVLGPLGLLFHQPFVLQVFVPLLQALRVWP
jgi:hypothetical protein